MTRTVPWNASWSEEDRFEIRPCRWVDMRPALWAPHQPRKGSPLFAQPHPVRQRMSIARMLCTVCGEHTPPGDRWWFGLGNPLQDRPDWWATTEAPVHRACADLASRLCPRVRDQEARPFPPGASVLVVMIGGEEAAREFRLPITDRAIIGGLKLGWPLDFIAEGAA